MCEVKILLKFFDRKLLCPQIHFCLTKWGSEIQKRILLPFWQIWTFWIWILKWFRPQNIQNVICVSYFQKWILVKSKYWKTFQISTLTPSCCRREKVLLHKYHFFFRTSVMNITFLSQKWALEHWGDWIQFCSLVITEKQLENSAIK